MISYTRNFEDVILQRVLSDVPIGCYVDVGASFPVMDSNTYALYQKGWRGICIEPLGYKQAWDQARPEDILINAAVGEKPRQTTLHIYNQSQQISTCSEESMEHWKKHGTPPDRSVTVPVVTLNAVLAQHLGDRVLHLISIDAEGMEKEVLLGLDLKRYRPWVMIVEATKPGTPVPCHDKWESLILDSGYWMVYFDGVNRFYLSHEQPNLVARFALPPNVWDNFVMVTDLENQKKCAALEATVRKLTDELNAYQQRMLSKSTGSPV